LGRPSNAKIPQTYPRTFRQQGGGEWGGGKVPRKEPKGGNRGWPWENGALTVQEGTETNQEKAGEKKIRRLKTAKESDHVAGKGAEP